MSQRSGAASLEYRAEGQFAAGDSFSTGLERATTVNPELVV